MESKNKISRQDLINLKVSGLSYRSIGSLCGMSHQRVQQIISGKKQGSFGRCERCKREVYAIHRHHPDYSSSETVLLCCSCHIKVHAEHKRKLFDESVKNLIGDIKTISWSDFSKLRLRIGVVPNTLKDSFNRIGVEVIPKPIPVKKQKCPQPGRQPIQDKFTHLKVSRQRLWQLRKIDSGLCSCCGCPSDGVFCERCKRVKRNKLKGTEKQKTKNPPP